MNKAEFRRRYGIEEGPDAQKGPERREAPRAEQSRFPADAGGRTITVKVYPKSARRQAIADMKAPNSGRVVQPNARSADGLGISPKTFFSAWLQVYEREIHLKQILPREIKAQPPRREQGDIRVFSRKSRMKLIRIMNQLRTAELHHATFVTLTARHQEHCPETFRDVYFQRFLRALQKAIPSIVYLWRLEFHQDGFPHFHLILWTGRADINPAEDKYRLWIKRTWWNIIGDKSKASVQHSCDVKTCASRRAVMAYVSKYVAKEDEQANSALTGRRWGRSRNFNTKPIICIRIAPEEVHSLHQSAIKFLNQDPERFASSIQALHENDHWWLWLKPTDIYTILVRVFGADLIPNYKEYIQSPKILAELRAEGNPNEDQGAEQP